MTFEEYLVSKKIDSKLFSAKEKELWLMWKQEFEQVHPNSFTAQKLYLINPIRRKYQLKDAPPLKAEEPVKTEGTSVAPKPPAIGAKPMMKPVFKPKPKTD